MRGLVGSVLRVASSLLICLMSLIGLPAITAGEAAAQQVTLPLSQYEALRIDDLGYVQQSRDEMEVRFTLLAERYERGSVVVTSNLPFSKWDQIFKDPRAAAAAIDRRVHHSVIVELNVASYRAEAAKRAQGTSAE